MRVDKTMREIKGYGVAMICLNGHICCTGRPHAVVNDPAFKTLFGERLAASLAIYRHEHDHTHGRDQSTGSTA